jgi:hypothetical protein
MFRLRAMVPNQGLAPTRLGRFRKEIMGAMRETSPKDKKAETIWEVAAKEAVEGAPHQSGPGRDSYAREGGGRSAERRRIPVGHEVEIREER